jgi:hypothetical protein
MDKVQKKEGSNYKYIFLTRSLSILLYPHISEP